MKRLRGRGPVPPEETPEEAETPVEKTEKPVPAKKKKAAEKPVAEPVAEEPVPEEKAEEKPVESPEKDDDNWGISQMDFGF